jgi:hypothetical protein
MKWFLVSVGIGSLVLAAACSKTNSPVGGVVTTLPTEALAVLAKADAFDGAADKVVKKCFTCSLGMDGKPDQFTKVGGYEVHFCKPECKKAFDTNPEKAILAGKLPEAAKK